MADNEPRSKFADGFHAYFTSGRLVRDAPQVDLTGIASVSLEMKFQEQPLARGTGFFWRLPVGFALVTAWHNLSGLHHTTRVPISKHGGMPDRLCIRYTSKRPQLFQEQHLPLYVDDDMEEPRWQVHGDCGSHFDIAVVLLNLDHDVACANDFAPPALSHIHPGSDLFAVGYPQGVSTLGVLPVWKRGSLASEIAFPTEGHPKFLVDMAGRGGLSGAPVYRVQRGVVELPNGAGYGLGQQTEFLGLYSGRSADQLPVAARSGESSDLGYVWRPEIVVETLQRHAPDEKPEVGKGKLELSPIWEAASDRTTTTK